MTQLPIVPTSSRQSSTNRAACLKEVEWHAPSDINYRENHHNTLFSRAKLFLLRWMRKPLWFRKRTQHIAAQTQTQHSNNGTDSPRASRNSGYTPEVPSMRTCTLSVQNETPVDDDGQDGLPDDCSTQDSSISQYSNRVSSEETEYYYTYPESWGGYPN